VARRWIEQARSTGVRRWHGKRRTRLAGRPARQLCVALRHWLVESEIDLCLGGARKAMDGRGDAARGTRGVGQGWDMAGVGRHVRELAEVEAAAVRAGA